MLQFLGESPEFGKEPGLAGYCGGLLVAISWAYMASATANVSSDKRPLVIIGILHFLGTCLVTLVGIYLFVVPILVDRLTHSGQ